MDTIRDMEKTKRICCKRKELNQTNLDMKEIINQYISEVEDPYIRIYGNIKTKRVFMKNGKGIDTCFTNIIKRKIDKI